jgi:transcriptional regulator GlxA family with amidase domain
MSRDSVAQALDMHPGCQSHVRRAPGKSSFHGGVESMRLERARHLRQHSGMTVARVAHPCGHAAPSHLIRVFNKRFAAAPKNGRRAA